MAQHFLLSAATRTLSIKTIDAEGEDAAYRIFCKLRWPEKNGAGVPMLQQTQVLRLGHATLVQVRDLPSPVPRHERNDLCFA